MKTKKTKSKMKIPVIASVGGSVLNADGTINLSKVGAQAVAMAQADAISEVPTTPAPPTVDDLLDPDPEIETTLRAAAIAATDFFDGDAATVFGYIHLAVDSLRTFLTACEIGADLDRVDGLAVLSAIAADVLKQMGDK